MHLEKELKASRPTKKMSFTLEEIKSNRPTPPQAAEEMIRKLRDNNAGLSR